MEKEKAMSHSQVTSTLNNQSRISNFPKQSLASGGRQSPAARSMGFHAPHILLELPSIRITFDSVPWQHLFQ
jgi:hypothetical protein